jgi:hypothetical protein
MEAKEAGVVVLVVGTSDQSVLRGAVAYAAMRDGAAAGRLRGRNLHYYIIHQFKT